jgi:hypothetical protein
MLLVSNCCPGGLGGCRRIESKPHLGKTG